MSHVLKTVRVRTDAKDNPDGFYEINESDFDAKVHTLFQVAPAPAAPAPAAPAPAEVKKSDKK